MLPFAMSISFVLGIVVASLLWKREINIGRRPQRPTDGSYPYEKIESLLTDIEKSVLVMLRREMGEDRFVIPKVRFGDAVTLPKRTERFEFLMNLVRNKGVDFLVTSSDYAPIAVIQSGQNRSGLDNELIEEICLACGLPYLQLPNKRDYGPGELLELVKETIAEQKSRRIRG